MFDFEIHNNGAIEVSKNGTQILVASYDLDSDHIVIDHVSSSKAAMLEGVKLRKMSDLGDIALAVEAIGF